MLNQRFFVALVLLANFSCAHQRNKVFSTIDDVSHVFYKTEPSSMPSRFMDPKLEPYVSQFLEDASQRGHPVSQDMQDKLRQVIYVDALSTPAEPGIMAVCARFYGSDKTVFGTVSARWMTIEVLRKESQIYTGGNVFQLRRLLYHELFHCYFNKGHLPPGYSGIMAPSMNIYDKSAITDWTRLVDEMFSDKYFNLMPEAI